MRLSVRNAYCLMFLLLFVVWSSFVLAVYLALKALW